MKKLALPLAISVALLQGCGSDSAGTATFSLDLTDAPIDSATAVNIAFDRIEVIGEEGTFEFDLDETNNINLLDLQGSTSTSLLDGVELPAGQYEQIRLMIDGDATITLDSGDQYPITVPSADQTGYKLVSGFTLPANGSASFTIDFDVRKSVVVTGNEQSGTGYKLKPTLRLVDNSEVGHIAGTVAGELLSTDTCAVYAYEGADVTPVQESTSGEVVASSLVATPPGEAASYEIGFLVAGEYTVALTCDAANDSAESSEDAVTFGEPQNVTVTADETATANFDVQVSE